MIRFKDGHEISFNFPKEEWCGIFLGTTRLESQGQMTFKDNRGHLAVLSFGKVKKKFHFSSIRPNDYFEGTISRQGENFVDVIGSIMGYIDFNGKRYWDHEKIRPFKPIIKESPLLSDHSLREDLKFLKAGDMVQAQAAKVKLEENQRRDNRLRNPGK